MVQVARPVANSTPQQWTMPSEATGEAWEQIDEGVGVHDGLATWIQASLPENDHDPKIARFVLGPLTDPGVDSQHVIRVAHYAARGQDVDYFARLYEGATLRATANLHVQGTGEVEVSSASFPTGQIATITSGGYAGLILELDSGSLEEGEGPLLVSAIELEVPNVGGSPDMRATRHGVEVLADVPSIVRATRHGIEVLGPAGASIATALGWEVLGEPSTAGLRATRHGLEVLRPNALQTLLTSIGWEVLGDNSGLRATRHGLEVLAKNPVGTAAWLTSIGWEVLSGVPVGGLLRATRHGIEVLAMNPPVDKVAPLALPANMPAHLLANWGQPIRMATGWQTDVLEAPETGLEERRGLVRRPARVLEARCTALSVGAAGRALLSTSRRAVGRAPIALWQDASRVLGNPDARTLLCDTRWRRFFAGGRVVIHRVTGGIPTDVCYRLVVTVTDAALVLDEDLPATYPVGSRVAPCLDAEVQLQASATRPSGEVLEVAVRAIEVVGPSALPGITSALPAGAGTYAGLPVLDLLTDWREDPRAQLVVPGSSARAGRTSVVLPSSGRVLRGWDLNYPFDSRAKAFGMLGWFDGAKGRLLPFWQVGAGGEFRVVAVGTSSIDVEATDSIEDVIDFVPRVAVRTRAGQLLVRGVSHVLDLGGTFRLALDVPLPDLELEDLLRVGLAELSRFGEDAIVEEWTSGETGSLTYRTVGLTEDKPVAIDVPPAQGQAYTYGAKFEPPVGRVIQALGWYSTEEVEPWLESLDGAHLPAVVQINFNVGSFHASPPSKQDILDGLAIAANAGGVFANPSVVLLSVGMKDFTVNTGNNPGMTSPAGFPLDFHIATGTPYSLPFAPFTPLDLDGQIETLAQAIAEWGKPLLVSIGREFNNGTGYHPDHFPAAYRKIADKIRELGGDNVAFIYCWEPSGFFFKSGGIPTDPLGTWTSAGSINGADYADPRWYPGDDYVDWFGIDLFTAEQYFAPGGAHTQHALDFIAWVETLNKPLAMCEASPGGMDLAPEGQLDFYGDVADGAADWAKWGAPYYALVAAHPVIKLAIYTAHDYDAEAPGGYGEALGWHTHLLDVNAVFGGIYLETISAPKFIDQTELELLNRYSEFQP